MSAKRTYCVLDRMLDKQDVVDFVKEVEKYQCLYDKNSFLYANKTLKKRSWLDIAEKYKTNVNDCKEKWRKIRIAYMRSLKLAKSGNPPSKPYYLAEYLHFISDKRNNNSTAPVINSPPSPASSDSSSKLEIDECDHSTDSNVPTYESRPHVYERTPVVGYDFPVRHVEPYIYTPRINFGSSNTETGQDDNSRLPAVIVNDGPKNNDNDIRYEAQKIGAEEANPRRMFLLSLLPELELLRESEMRTFRREVISLLDNIITTRNNVIMNLSFKK